MQEIAGLSGKHKSFELKTIAPVNLANSRIGKKACISYPFKAGPKLISDVLCWTEGPKQCMPNFNAHQH